MAMTEYTMRVVAFDDEDEAYEFIEGQEHWLLLDDTRSIGLHMIERSPTPGEYCFLLFDEVKQDG